MATTGTLQTLQSSIAVAANGATFVVGKADLVTIEASGSLAAMTCVVEGSVDGGTTWNILSVATMSSTTLARVAAISALGCYTVDVRGLSHLRCRLTGAGGPATIRVLGAAG